MGKQCPVSAGCFSKALVALWGVAAALTAGEVTPSLPAGLQEEQSPAAGGDSTGSGPALPEGLAPEEGKEEGTGSAAESGPSLPEGLGGGEGPALPQGIGGGQQTEDEAAFNVQDEGAVSSFREYITGFWDIRGGVRVHNDHNQKDSSLGEARLQLEVDHTWEGVTFLGRCDLLADPVLDRHKTDLNTGEGWLDLREASFSLTPLDFMDVKLGRQILTWGTGDLLFLNDLFPKDWRSFFIGRDVEYLKAPSDALKTSFFTRVLNLDVVYTPQFDHDRFIRGWRLSYYQDGSGFLGRDQPVRARIPGDWFEDDEFSLRLHRTLGSMEVAAYGYFGYWKSPSGQDPAKGRYLFPELNVYGASVRSPFQGGIANGEIAYYDSLDDSGGGDAFVKNSQARYLVGYKRDLPSVAEDLSLGLQYYLEWMLDYGDYKRALRPSMHKADEFRHVITCRLRKQYLRQNLTASLFAYYSPPDSDTYLRPSVAYDIDDRWTVEAGANLFFGRHDYTFFGQLEHNSNLYGALRYNF